MVTGNNVEQLIAATGYDAAKGVYTMSYDTGTGKRKVYSLSEKQLVTAGNDETVAYSSTHQNLLALVNKTMLANIADSGETPTGEKLNSKSRYDSKNLKDGGLSNFLPELLNANSTAKLYVNNGNTLISGEIDEQGNFTDEVDNATANTIVKPKQHLTVAQIAQLYNQDTQQQITLDIAPENAKNISKSLKDKGIRTQHAYTLLNVNETAGTVTVLNPWDATKPITLNASVFDCATVTKLG